MYSYKGLESKLKERNITKSDLVNILNISSRTIAKISKGQKLSNNTLNKIAIFLNCSKEDLYKEVLDNKVLQTLKEEKEYKISGGLYHLIQIKLTYNSNHIEGSKLDEDQTRMIFETRTIDSKDIVSIDDIIETSNHFRAIDYIIDVALLPLSEEIIKKIHFILKSGTKDSFLEWINAREYKQRQNIIGNKITSSPSNVPLEMKKLLKEYNQKSNITLEDIIEFHVKFENIHPFQDGNGRVGRLIMFKECLKNNITPFIIEDSKKAFYYRGLSKRNEEKGFLIDTFLDAQDNFENILKIFEIN